MPLDALHLNYRMVQVLGMGDHKDHKHSAIRPQSATAKRVTTASAGSSAGRSGSGSATSKRSVTISSGTARPASARTTTTTTTATTTSASASTNRRASATAAAAAAAPITSPATPYSAVLAFNTRNKRTSHISLAEAERVLSDSRVFVSSDVPSLTSERCNRTEAGHGRVQCSGGLPRSAWTDPHYTKKLNLSHDTLIDALSHSNAIRSQTRTRLMSLPLRVLPSYRHCYRPTHQASHLVTQREWRDPNGVPSSGVNAFGQLEVAKHAPAPLGASEQTKLAAHVALTAAMTAAKRMKGAGVKPVPASKKKKYWSTAGGTNHELIFEISDISLIGFLKIHNKQTRNIELAVAMNNKPAHWITVREPIDVATEKELVFRVGFLPARFVRVLCRKGAPISLYSVEALGIPVGTRGSSDDEYAIHKLSVNASTATTTTTTNRRTESKYDENGAATTTTAAATTTTATTADHDNLGDELFPAQKSALAADADHQSGRWRLLSSEMRRVCVENTIRCLYSPCVLPPAPALRNVYPLQAGAPGDDRPPLASIDAAANKRVATIRFRRENEYLHY